VQGEDVEAGRFLEALVKWRVSGYMLSQGLAAGWVMRDHEKASPSSRKEREKDGATEDASCEKGSATGRCILAG
jgi:hypothetical protein